MLAIVHADGEVLLRVGDRRLETDLGERYPALCVGDNKPYDGRVGRGYGVAMHGEREGLPHVLLELRQDLIDTHHGAADWAERLACVFGEILA